MYTIYIADFDGYCNVADEELNEALHDLYSEVCEYLVDRFESIVHSDSECDKFADEYDYIVESANYADEFLGNEFDENGRKMWSNYSEYHCVRFLPFEQVQFTVEQE